MDELVQQLATVEQIVVDAGEMQHPVLHMATVLSLPLVTLQSLPWPPLLHPRAWPVDC